MKKPAPTPQTTPGKRPRRSAPVRLLGLSLACLAGLSACAPGGADSADAEPAPIEVPPPVEQTNEGLTIFYTDYNEVEAKILDAAISQFNQQHPDTPVTADKHFADGLYTSHQDAYTKMITEVMAGDGPDLFLYDFLTMDVEKMARRGVFADLEPYFEADHFDWSGYNQAVMEGGVWDGHRLVVPLSYSLPVLYTSQTALDETGFTVENCGTFDGFLDEVEKIESDPKQTREAFRSEEAFYYFPYNSGLPYVDYDRQTADLSFPELEQGASIYKNLKPVLAPGFADGSDMAGAADIRDGKCLFTCPDFSLYGFFLAAGCINKLDDAVMLPIRDTQGGIRARISSAIAVRNSSSNLQVAYEFIKFLLSEEFQLDTIGWRWQHFSVLDAANERYYIENTVERDNSMIAPDNPYGFEGNIVLPQADYDELASYMDEVGGVFFYTADTNFMRQIKDYLSGNASYQEAVHAAERQMELYLSE